MQTQIGFAWHWLRVRSGLKDPDLRLSEDELFETFALATVDPLSDLARDFLSEDWRHRPSEHD